MSSFRILCSPIPVLSNGTGFVQLRGGGGANKNVLRKTAPLLREAQSNRQYKTASVGQAVSTCNLRRGKFIAEV